MPSLARKVSTSRKSNKPGSYKKLGLANSWGSTMRAYSICTNSSLVAGASSSCLHSGLPGDGLEWHALLSRDQIPSKSGVARQAEPPPTSKPALFMVPSCNNIARSPWRTTTLLKSPALEEDLLRSPLDGTLRMSRMEFRLVSSFFSGGGVGGIVATGRANTSASKARSCAEVRVNRCATRRKQQTRWWRSHEEPFKTRSKR
mmetsp:Transcript_18045/g.63382  ORF Transcript_18045/g.63382 Transcript_18045/m.63382 type:complete len:202 (+) Transcript_18045:669-1274(+)